MKLQVLMYYQDDPKKCTAAKMIKFNLAKPVKKIFSKTLVLHPFAEKTLIPSDRSTIRSILGVDCSWSLAEKEFSKKFSGIPRKLPPLLAGNPINYSKLNKLTTVEALSGALFILGETDQALTILDKFKWGHTFFELNQNLLDEYSKVKTEDEINRILQDYGIITS